jgi:hypothetical protein
MFGFSAERPMFSWLLSHLGPPPPPPRRHFSKTWDSDPQHWVAARLPRLGLGAQSRDAQARNGASGTR